MNEQRYAVFFSDGGYQHNEDDQGEFSGVGLEEIIALGAKRWPHCDPVAWAPEWPGYGLSTTQLRESSLAAGRLIEKTPSGWVALGAEKQEEPAIETAIGEDCSVQFTGTYNQAEVDRIREQADAEMNDRDQRKHAQPEPVRFDPFKGFRVGSNHIWQVGEERADHPSPFGIFRSPDCESGPSDHLNASRHQMAGMKG